MIIQYLYLKPNEISTVSIASYKFQEVPSCITLVNIFCDFLKFYHRVIINCNNKLSLAQKSSVHNLMKHFLEIF